jgi:hypothetical protein
MAFIPAAASWPPDLHAARPPSGPIVAAWIPAAGVFDQRFDSALRVDL